MSFQTVLQFERCRIAGQALPRAVSSNAVDHRLPPCHPLFDVRPSFDVASLPRQGSSFGCRCPPPRSANQSPPIASAFKAQRVACCNALPVCTLQIALPGRYNISIQAPQLTHTRRILGAMSIFPANSLDDRCAKPPSRSKCPMEEGQAGTCAADPKAPTISFFWVGVTNFRSFLPPFVPFAKCLGRPRRTLDCLGGGAQIS